MPVSGIINSYKKGLFKSIQLNYYGKQIIYKSFFINCITAIILLNL